MKMLAPELLLFVLFLTSSYEIGVSHILEGASGQRPWNEKPEESSCGRQSSNPSLFLIRKIINGMDAIPHSWPWQVLVLLDGYPSCGGTIINSDTILTAAHCVITETGELPAYRLTVAAGLDDRFYVPGNEIGVGFAVPHSGFLASNKDFDDIAILFLERDLDFGYTIQPLCLPNPGEQPRVDEFCMVTGWGATVDDPETEIEENSIILQQAEVRIVSNLVCQDAYHSQYPISDSGHICAGGARADTCQGDSGGPLQCKRSNGSWYLAGITSWGDECGGGTPGVYTQVENYLDWVNENIGPSKR